jgi:hypothetical protein
MLEYALVLLVAVAFHALDWVRHAPWVYGRFYWSDQASRLILFTLHAILCTVIVLRLQRHRLLSTSDRLAGLFNRAWRRATWCSRWWPPPSSALRRSDLVARYGG